MQNATHAARISNHVNRIQAKVNAICNAREHWPGEPQVGTEPNASNAVLHVDCNVFNMHWCLALVLYNFGCVIIDFTDMFKT